MKNKAVIITGSGRGIGAATARLFAEKGYSVCINYKSNRSAAEELATDIKKDGGNCIVVQADVSDEKDVEKLFRIVDEQLGELSVLVNNAGILQKQCRLEKLTAERINKILTNNVTSYFLCCREAVKRMSTLQGGAGGSIITKA